MLFYIEMYERNKMMITAYRLTAASVVLFLFRLLLLLLIQQQISFGGRSRQLPSSTTSCQSVYTLTAAYRMLEQDTHQ